MNKSRVGHPSGVWMWGLGLALIIGLVLILSQFHKPSPSEFVTVTAQATGTDAPTPDIETEATATRPFVSLGRATAVPTIDERPTETYIATVLIGRTAVGATADQLLTDQPIVQGPRPTGIFAAGIDVFRYPNQDVVIENQWQNVLTTVNGIEYWAVVHAGARHSDPDQGIVIVGFDGPDHTYLTSIRAGSVHIVSEQNLRLTLVSTNGTTFYFDVPGQAFVASLTEVVPTVTPFQTYTPTPTLTPAPTQTVPPTCTPGPTPGDVTAVPDCMDY